MNRNYSLNEAHAIPVTVGMRRHRLSVLLGLLICCLAMFLLLGVLDMPLWLSLAGAVIGLVLPPIIAYRLWPVRDTVTIGNDALLFSRRGRVPYATIASYSADDYLKLVRDAEPTWMLTSSQTPRLRAEFIAAFDAWQAAKGTRDRGNSAPFLREPCGADSGWLHCCNVYWHSNFQLLPRPIFRCDECY
jgi:hypothetical protein